MKSASHESRHFMHAAGPVWRTHIHEPVLMALEPVALEGPPQDVAALPLRRIALQRTEAGPHV